MATAAPELLSSLLKQVSRSFYLTLRVLPNAIRPQIGLAYLLARATDTIADTEIVPVADRLQALHALRQRILGQTSAPLTLQAMTRGRDEASSKRSDKSDVESAGKQSNGATTSA